LKRQIFQAKHLFNKLHLKSLKATEPLQGSSFTCCVDVDMSAFRIKRYDMMLVLSEASICCHGKVNIREP